MEIKVIYSIGSVIALLLLSGCAGKTASNPINPPVAATTEENQEASPTTGVNVLGEPVASPAGTTITTLNGNQLEAVYFDYNSFTLKTTSLLALDRNASWLSEHPEVRVTIEGHCDERGSDEYNLALGERRAMAVKGYLAARGIPGERLMTVSYGEENPAAAGHDETAWAQNRRAAFN